MEAQIRINVFKIRVISDVHRSSRMQEIGEQNIEVHILGGLQRGVGLIRQQTVVLGDKSQRELACELIIPLRAEDVAINYGVVSEPVGHTLQNVGVVNLKPAKWLDPDRLIHRCFIARIRQLSRGRDNYDRAVVKNARAPVERAPGTAAKNNSAALLGHLLIASQPRKTRRRRKVHGAKDVGLVPINGSENDIAS